MNRLQQQVVRAIRTHRLFAPDDRVWVGVSGGADSVALVDLLESTGSLHEGRLAVVHVDHAQHPDSAEWARGVRSLAESRGLHCVVVRAALEPGASEAAAREARYAVFDALDGGVVALAHHANDQAETGLMQLLRGTSRGARGMRYRRGRFVRPLLDVARSDLLDWCAQRWLPTLADPANEDERFLRVRVRSTVVPML